MAFIMPRKERASYNGVRGYLDGVGYKNGKEKRGGHMNLNYMKAANLKKHTGLQKV